MIICDNLLVYNHNQPLALDRKTISNSVKRKATDQGTYKPLKWIMEEIAKIPLELTQSLSKNYINWIRRNVYRLSRISIEFFNCDKIY